MARGDAIAVIQSINATSYVAVQPSGGVEWLINCWTANNNNNADTMRAWDGSNYVYLNFGGTHGSTSGPTRNMKCIATNTTYFYVYNAQGTTQYQYYGGYVTKD